MILTGAEKRPTPADNIRWRALLATLASAHPANEADNPLRGLQLIRRPRWAAHFFSEGNAARAQMEQIKQEKNKKQAKRQGATHDKR